MELTLDEQERIAYITNAPEHKFIAAALDAEQEAESLQTRIDELEDQQ